jgi:outer membrane protein OmpA-like peptidoglycan-associated protein
MLKLLGLIRLATALVLVAVLLPARPAIAAGEAEALPGSAGRPISFVTCPIVRDTATVPCWLAEHDGELYYLGIQVDIGAAWYPPQLGHDVLVEGRVAADRPRICGGIVIEPIKTSVLPELNPACTTMWPAEDRYTVPFAPRGPGPANRGLERLRQQQDPQAQTDLPPTIVAANTPKDFVVYFDFDTHLMPGGRPARIIGEAIRYAQAAKAKRVVVTGYRGVSRLSDGRELVEMPVIPERRAQMVAYAFREAGIAASVLEVRWQAEPEPGNGIDDPLRRRVVIAITP